MTSIKKFKKSWAKKIFLFEKKIPKTEMNLNIFIFLINAPEILIAFPATETVQPDLVEPIMNLKSSDLSRSSRDLIYWNRVTNKHKQYE